MAPDEPKLPDAHVVAADVAQLRRDYRGGGLRRTDLAADPVEQFRHWFEQACGAGLLEPDGRRQWLGGRRGECGQREPGRGPAAERCRQRAERGHERLTPP